ncbi:MAG: choice-of-anchor Q domain-containing protein [Kiritimatiellia bacterium]|nr:choice-of-anchor Q domain-containing protein [Kiritimatiellia bacterium]
MNNVSWTMNVMRIFVRHRRIPGRPESSRAGSLRLTILVGLFWFGALMSQAAITTNYVAQGGQTPSEPYTTWDTAASNIQDAISVATGAGSIVLVSNGVYETGGVANWPAGTVLTNRVAITNAITVKSANNDPTNTIIKGHWASDGIGITNGPDAVRCVYMVDGSKLIGFMLTNGATMTNVAADKNGGGVNCQSISATISNCIIAGNSAYSSGGGAYYGTLYNCAVVGNSSIRDGGGSYFSVMYDCMIIRNSILLYADGIYGAGCRNGYNYNCTFISNSAGYHAGGSAYGTRYNCTYIGNSALYGGGMAQDIAYNCKIIGNSATSQAGGARLCTLYNCTIVSNSASSGGGVNYGVLYNCIVYYNTGGADSNYVFGGSTIFTNCCTAPAQTGWATPGNITDNPQFVDFAGGNFRLAPNSPCVNAGTNQSWMTNAVDLDGRIRIRYGTVDMGAYERINSGTIFSFR